VGLEENKLDGQKINKN